MADRVAETAQQTADTFPGESSPAAPSGSPSVAAAPAGVAALKHCWVAGEHGRLPALLLQWRRTATGFQGRVVHPVPDSDLGWVLVEEWLPAGVLEPA